MSKNKLETYKVKDWVVFGCTYFQPPFKVSDDLINEARIVHVLNGRSTLFSANQFTNLEKGDTLIMKTDRFINNWLENESGAMNKVIAFQLHTDFLKHIYNNKLPDWFIQDEKHITDSVEKVTPSPFLDSYFENLQNYLGQPVLITEELIQIKIRELISILIHADHSGAIKKIFGNLFKANEYEFQEIIQKNLFKDLNIDDLAFFSGMSLSSFKRKFSSIYGTTPNKYIVSKRLEKAQTLLNTTNFTITEIAYDCGFSDVGYFSKTFKRYYNVSPSDVRKNALD